MFASPRETPRAESLPPSYPPQSREKGLGAQCWSDLSSLQISTPGKGSVSSVAKRYKELELVPEFIETDLLWFESNPAPNPTLRNAELLNNTPDVSMLNKGVYFGKQDAPWSLSVRKTVWEGTGGEDEPHTLLPHN